MCTEYREEYETAKLRFGFELIEGSDARLGVNFKMVFVRVFAVFENGYMECC